MACSTIQTGRDTIKILKDMFHLPDNITKLTLVASMDSVTTIDIETLAELKDVDITSTEVSRDDVIDTHTYEVTINRVDK